LSCQPSIQILPVSERYHAAMEFLRVGNHPGVDLCNTVPVVGGETVEILAESTHLREGLAAAPPTACFGDQRPTRQTLAWVHRLRQALRAVLTAGADRHDELRALNSILAALSAVPFVNEHGKLELRSAKTQEQIRLGVASMAIDACRLPPDRVRR